MVESSLDSMPQEQAVEQAVDVFQRIDLDPEGDVYFLLPTRRFLVSSKIVGNASPVFKALLGPHFLEGQQVSITCPGSVPLSPDDDAEVTTIILKVIHHRPQPEPLELSATFLVKLASACDKYDCAAALSSWSSVRIHAFMNDPGKKPFFGPGRDEDGQILFSTYMLDDSRGFQQITKRMIYRPSHHHGIVNALGPKPYGLSEEAQARLPKGLIMSIALKELSIKTNLLEDLEKVIEKLVKKPPRKQYGPFLRGDMPEHYKSHHKYRACECDNTRINLLLKKMASAQLYPLARLSQTESLHRLLSRVEDLVSYASGASHDYHDHHVQGHLECDRCNSSLVQGTKEAEARAKGAFSGFCLDCVKLGEEAGNDGTDKCRTSHLHNGYLGIYRGWYGPEKSNPDGDEFGSSIEQAW
ncbi:hypothetical protein MMC30_001934 [Trapelia coarctata]|nr:hypothetical protein [Trapelia coarctata]